MFRHRIHPIALLAVALPTLARADPLLSGVLAPQVMVASDYRYDGVSESAEHPVIQGSLYWWRPDKTYAGIFITQVNFHDPGKTSYEVDSYVGHKFQLKGTELTPEVMYTAFPDNRTWGPTYDFWQLKLKARRKTGQLSYGGEVSWVPQASYRGGVMWRAAALGEYRLSGKVSLTGKIGEIWPHHGFDRVFYEFGGKLATKQVWYELRYVGSDLKRNECGYLQNTWCRPAIVGTVTFNLPYLPLKR